MPSQFSFSSARLCRVQKLQFGILSPDEVVSIEVVAAVASTIVYVHSTPCSVLLHGDAHLCSAVRSSHSTAELFCR